MMLLGVVGADGCLGLFKLGDDFCLLIVLWSLDFVDWGDVALLLCKMDVFIQHVGMPVTSVVGTHVNGVWLI